MTDLDHIRADVSAMHAQAVRLQQMTRRVMARHASTPLWMVEYVTESERAWGHVMERCHNLDAQITRMAAGEAWGGERVP